MAWTIGHDEPFDEPECECEAEECICDVDDGDDYDPEREAYEQKEAADQWHSAFGPTGGP